MLRIIRRSKFISIQPDIEQAVRRGDLYGIIIEFHFEKREYERCLDNLKKMKESQQVFEAKSTFQLFLSSKFSAGTYIHQNHHT